MPRKFKNWKHVEHTTNFFEQYKAEKLYKGIYGKENVKIIGNRYFGHYYVDIYIKRYAKPKRKLSAMFGSYMTFEDNKGRKYGDRVLVKENV